MEIKNVTEIFKKVITSHVNWAISMFYQVMEILESKEVGLSFWEGEEDWASIVIDGKVVGYIWRRYPLVIVEQDVAYRVKAPLKDIEMIYYIEVVALDKDLFKIEDDELMTYFFTDFSIFKSFTMVDLWFYTNT